MATAPSLPIKEGYLDLKCGHLWRKCHFTITGNRKLFCREDGNNKEWDVKSVETWGRDTERFIFEVSFYDEINKSWILGATSDKERKEWMQALIQRNHLMKSKSLHESLTDASSSTTEKPPPIPPRIRTSSVGTAVSTPSVQSQFILNEDIKPNLHFHQKNAHVNATASRHIVRPTLVPYSPPIGGNISMPVPNQPWNDSRPPPMIPPQTFPMQQPLQYPNAPPLQSPPYPNYYPPPTVHIQNTQYHGNISHFSPPPPPLPAKVGEVPSPHKPLAANQPITNQQPFIESKETPFHTVALKSISELLKDYSTDPNARDSKGYTALHWYIAKPRKDRHELLMRCLESGRQFDVNARDRNNWTPLHFAAQENDMQYVKILVAFGAEMTCKNHNDRYPYEITGDPEIRQLLTPFESYSRSLLHLFMPQRNELYNINELEQELESMPWGRYITIQSMPRLVQVIDNRITQQEEATYQKLNNSDYPADAFILQRKYLNSWKETAGTRVLFLDGGGIRGLVQIEVLMELERRTGCRVIDLFDYIVGTSTGGIVALGLVYAKKTLSEMKQIYLQIKDKVFGAASKLPTAYMHMKQNSSNLEEILKRELGGEHLLMSSVQKPRVMVSVVQREPLKLLFFNNFMTNDDTNKQLTNIPVWIAARATSAAPVYFTPCQEKYLDGGVMANNPCQEAMKVITDYDKKCGIPFRHFSLIMSIGTGQYMANEETERSDKGVFLMKHFIQIKEIVNIFLKQLLTSESSSHIFGAWCEKARRPIPFFRFNPEFKEDVSSAETDDRKIVDLIVNTKKYLRAEEILAKMDKVVALFQKFDISK